MLNSLTVHGYSGNWRQGQILVIHMWVNERTPASESRHISRYLSKYLYSFVHIVLIFKVLKFRQQDYLINSQ